MIIKARSELLPSNLAIVTLALAALRAADAMVLIDLDDVAAHPAHNMVEEASEY